MAKMLTRRKLLASGSLAGAAAVLPAVAQKSRAENLPANARIAVIGAGFAGIGAARTLLDLGYSVDVIEARDRLGGRAHSVPFGNGTADLGAAWLHSTPYNPLLPLAKKTGVEHANTNFASHLALSKDGRIDQIVLSTESTTAPFETMTGPGLS